MAEAGPGPFVRPLLGLERAQLRRWLARRGLAFREDPTNRSQLYDRNRLRRLVLPVIVRELNPRAPRQLVRSARLLREDALYLDALAAEIAARLWRHEPGRPMALDAAGWADTPPVLARRIARVALERAGVDPRRIAARHVEAVLALRDAPGGSELHLPGRRVARRLRGRIEIG
jgi:tRNA(Ile)-lysidine synthase